MKDIVKYIVPYILLTIVMIIIGWIDFEYNRIVLGIIIPAFILYYLRIDNPHKTYLNLFSITLIVCFSVAALSSIYSWNPILLKVCIATSALVYLLRFLKRNEKLWVDYLKTIVVLIGATTVNIKPEFLPAIAILLGFIYVLDRLIIRRQMKKITQIIVFSFLVLVCLTFVIYGQIKANDAMMSAEAAKAAQQEAMEVADMARQQAQDAAAEAIRQQAMVAQIQDELTKCKGE